MVSAAIWRMAMCQVIAHGQSRAIILCRRHVIGHEQLTTGCGDLLVFRQARYQVPTQPRRHRWQLRIRCPF